MSVLYKNVLIHNAAELTENADGSVSWLRLPAWVRERLESDRGVEFTGAATGVELRFVLRSPEVRIRMAVSSGDGIFHVYRGSLQGGWEDHEVGRQVGTSPRDYVIRRSEEPEQLKAMSRAAGAPFRPEVVRVIFDRGFFRLYDIVGEVTPPEADQCPARTLLAYGSSITHGSNSLDMSHAWASLLGHRLGMDVRNLGMAGSCRMEPALVDWIAREGQAGRWDAAVLELGINVLDWEEALFASRVENTLRRVAGGNPGKPVYAVSPFYHCREDFDPGDRTYRWRELMREITDRLALPNLTCIDGRSVLDGMAWISADRVHPNIYGVQKIADELTARLAPELAPSPRPGRAL